MVEITPYALKGQKLLAQGIALGNRDMSNAPCKGKSFKKNNKGLKIKSRNYGKERSYRFDS